MPDILSTVRRLAPVAAFLLTAAAAAADFATPGGPRPGNVDEVSASLREDPYDMELLISFGTSKGGSAGHLALALRGEIPDDEMVYSANFYADRAPEHARDFHTADLMLRIPKKEYLWGTTSSLGPKASFGLDFGEVYKRSVVGIRVYGVPADERAALARYFQRINADYLRQAPKTEYHDEEVRYGYMHLNCAKTIGSAFKWGAGYGSLEVKSAGVLRGRGVRAIRNANVPTDMAMKLMREWDARGYRMDAVLYAKYRHSPYVDPHEEEKVAFRDLPNRFPSVISLDFRNDERHYEDYDNLLPMYLLHNMVRHAVVVDAPTQRVQVMRAKDPMGYKQAQEAAATDAESDSRNFLRRLLFKRRGKRIDIEAIE